jgi:hypothetical protein
MQSVKRIESSSTSNSCQKKGNQQKPLFVMAPKRSERGWLAFKKSKKGTIDVLIQSLPTMETPSVCRGNGRFKRRQLPVKHRLLLRDTHTQRRRNSLGNKYGLTITLQQSDTLTLTCRRYEMHHARTTSHTHTQTQQQKHNESFMIGKKKFVNSTRLSWTNPQKYSVMCHNNRIFFL